MGGGIIGERIISDGGGGIGGGQGGVVFCRGTIIVLGDVNDDSSAEMFITLGEGDGCRVESTVELLLDR